MIKTRHLFVAFTVALPSWLTVSSAHALNDHSWVSIAGSGTACTRTAPCGNFFTAQSATNAGGMISVLDPGDFFGANITKPITIRAEGVDGGATSTIGGGYWITVNAGPTDVIALEGCI